MVPSTFLPVLRAEHTTTILLSLRLALYHVSDSVPSNLENGLGIPDDILTYLNRELSHACPSKFLNNPSAIAVILSEGSLARTVGLMVPIREWWWSHRQERMLLRNSMKSFLNSR